MSHPARTLILRAVPGSAEPHIQTTNSKADEFNYDVFLSHSVKDKPIVRDVAERLRNDGLRVWLDEWVLKPGDHVQTKIEAGLE